MDSTWTLVKGADQPWYWLVTGDAYTWVRDFDELARFSHSLNDTSYRLYSARLQAQGKQWEGGQQYYCYDGLDEGGNAKPFVWDQELLDRLNRFGPTAFEEAPPTSATG